MKILFEQRKEDDTYTCNTAIVKEVRKDQRVCDYVPGLKNTAMNYGVEEDRIHIGLYEDGLEQTSIVLTDLRTCTHAIPEDLVNDLLFASELALEQLEQMEPMFKNDDPDFMEALNSLREAFKKTLTYQEKGYTE